MNKKETILPTKDEVVKLLNIAKNDDMLQLQTVGDLLGIKYTDSLMPKIKEAPEWGVEGLSEFFNGYDIDDSCSLEEALERLND